VKYNGDVEDVVIPDTIGGLPVTVIGESAFEENKTLLSVTISDSVVSIEKSAFEECTSLESIELGKNVEKIGEDAFISCWNLEQVILNKKLIEIGEDAFCGCSVIETMDLPDSVEVIAIGAFSATGIKEFVFPPKVTVISECVFEESDLQSVVLPDNVQAIEIGAFRFTAISEIFIPDSVIEIGEDAFYDCSESLILFYGNNQLVPQYAQENNILCFQVDEYNPVLTVDLVGGEPLNDDLNLGISQDDYNLVSRRPMNYIEDQIQRGVTEANNFYDIAFGNTIYNAYSGFTYGDDLSQTAIQQKLAKLSTLLYQCGITEYDPETINTGEAGCLDKLVTAALYCRWPDVSEDDVIDGCDVRFTDDQFLFVEALALFDFTPDPSLVTGYSEQQHGIWYYPKELPEVTTEVLSFNGNLGDGNYILKVKFTDDSGATCEKTFSYSLVQYDSVGGSNYRVILKGIQ